MIERKIYIEAFLINLKLFDFFFILLQMNSFYEHV